MRIPSPALPQEGNWIVCQRVLVLRSSRLSLIIVQAKPIAATKATKKKKYAVAITITGADYYYIYFSMKAAGVSTSCRDKSASL